MKIQVLHKSDKELDDLWYDIDTWEPTEDDWEGPEERAQKICNSYVRLVRVIEEDHGDVNVYGYFKPAEDMK